MHSYVRTRIALVLFLSVLLFLPAPVSAMCADTASCRIFSASMLTILCIPIYVIGFIILAIPATRPGSIVFGVLAILAGAQATFAVVPTRPDLLWYVAIHFVSALLYLIFGIRAIVNKPKVEMVQTIIT